MLVFGERGKPEYSGKNLQEQSGKPTNSIPYDSRFWKSNPHDIGGRRVLSIINSILERVTTNKQALVKSNLNNNATKLQQNPRKTLHTPLSLRSIMKFKQSACARENYLSHNVFLTPFSST